ncbi:amidohydrolase [Rhodococcus sp. T2V]|uniref:amidohydrolase n=1 Tax=Rhodococcus sp. T2V TaxID=3034164 RepID=UPI0023E14148|nr:amidohydrolase [Rhodococcus sp. T2V]MDF3312846.1 amidohydrolase [Rhodococcus sp. T2V]
MEITKHAAALVDSHAPVFTELADAIWGTPQLRWAEFDAVERQTALAEKYGFQITRALAGIPTAFSAEYGEDGPVIAFLGEYDGLAGLSQQSGVAVRTPDSANTSGNGHGCGHHLLGAGSLLAAVATAAYLKEHQLPGRVRYYGCPAEEAAAGKSFMVKGGEFDDVDAAVTWHPFPRMSTRQMLFLAYTQVYFTFRGVASHAGSTPHQGRSALDALELMNVGVNFLREHMADSSRIHYAITDAGGESPNVVQAQATAYYIVRARTVAEMRELYARVVKIAEGAALMTETELEIRFDGASAEVLPNEVLEEVLHGHAQTLGGVPFDEADRTMAQEFLATCTPSQIEADRSRAGLSQDDTRALHDCVPTLDSSQPRHQECGSTDVGDVSWVTPTVQIFNPCYALGSPPHSWQWVAQGKLPAAHKGMVHAAQVMAATAADLFTNPELLTRARTEFAETITRTPYDCPIPDGVLAPPVRALQKDPHV